MDEKWIAIADVPGRLQAELLRGLLESQGIQVFLSQEGAGSVYGLTVGPLGSVQVLVPNGDYDRAEVVLEEYYSALEHDQGSDAEDFVEGPND